MTDRTLMMKNLQWELDNVSRMVVELETQLINQIMSYETRKKMEAQLNATQQKLFFVFNLMAAAKDEPQYVNFANLQKHHSAVESIPKIEGPSSTDYASVRSSTTSELEQPAVHDTRTEPTEQHQLLREAIVEESDGCSFCCIPSRASSTRPTSTPTMNTTISDYAPSIAPHVPALIVLCVHEIETRGLEEVGLYRICGSSVAVKQLNETFHQGNARIQLSSTGIHVLCGCLKLFLKSLSETLIPTEMRSMLANAAENRVAGLGYKQMQDTVKRMPPANRDTLAFLIQHLQRVAQCPAVKMPLPNIAIVFAPTIVGYSNKDLDIPAMASETKVITGIMMGLLEIPTRFWQQFTNPKPVKHNSSVTESLRRRLNDFASSTKLFRNSSDNSQHRKVL